MAKKFQEDLNADSAGNNEYTSVFSVGVASARRSSSNGEPATAGHMMLWVHEDRTFLVGGDFMDFSSHIDIELKKVNGSWTCTTAQSTVDSATTSHGPVDLPFPPKTHDLTRSMRGLLDDVQEDPAPPKNGAPKPSSPSQRA
jgi:hypothetical protein